MKRARWTDTFYYISSALAIQRELSRSQDGMESGRPLLYTRPITPMVIGVVLYMTATNKVHDIIESTWNTSLVGLSLGLPPFVTLKLDFERN